MSLLWNFGGGKISNSHLHFWCGINGSSLVDSAAAWNFSVLNLLRRRSLMENYFLFNFSLFSYSTFCWFITQKRWRKSIENFRSTVSFWFVQEKSERKSWKSQIYWEKHFGVGKKFQSNNDSNENQQSWWWSFHKVSSLQLNGGINRCKSTILHSEEI